MNHLPCQFIDLAPHIAAKGFNLGHAYEALTEYAARYSEGILPEYREAEAAGLLNDGDDFGPSAWVRDMGAEHLMQRWSDAFNLLERLRNREEPTAFFTELFNKLRADFDEARKWLETTEVYDDTEYRRAYDEYVRERADHEARLKERLDRKPTYEELYGEGTPTAPKAPQGVGYSKSYVDSLGGAMVGLSTVWEKSFPLENSFYLATQKENGDDSIVAK